MQKTSKICKIKLSVFWEFERIMAHLGSCIWITSLDVALACENIRFSRLFAAGDVLRETSPTAKSEEKRIFSQANVLSDIQVVL